MQRPRWIRHPLYPVGPETVSAESVGADHASLLGEEANGTAVVEITVHTEQSASADDGAEMGNAESESQSTQNSQSSASAVNYDEVLLSLDDFLMDTEENVFKIPPKRKRSKKSDNLLDLSGTDNSSMKSMKATFLTVASPAAYVRVGMLVAITVWVTSNPF